MSLVSSVCLSCSQQRLKGQCLKSKNQKNKSSISFFDMVLEIRLQFGEKQNLNVDQSY